MKRSMKWPLVPYKGKWQETFSELQAMETFKKEVVEEHNASTKNFITILTDCFHRYGSNPKLSAYSFLVKDLLQKGQFSHLSPILDHLELSEKFEVPEKFFVYLIQEYGKADMLQEAVDIFFRIPKFRCTPSACSLNSLLSVLCKKNNGLLLAHDVLLKSLELCIRLEASTFHILIKALCRTGRVRFAVELLNIMHEFDEFIPDAKFYSTVLCALCKYSTSLEVMDFLKQMQNAELQPSAFEYNSVINVLVREGKPNDAYSILTRMKLEDRRPDVISYTTVLDGFILAGDFCMAEEVFDEMLVMGVVPDVCTYNTYISGLCKQGDFRRACRMLSCMERAGCKPDTETYNTLMEGYAKAGETEKARETMSEMLEKGFHCNSRTYMILMDGLISEGKMVEARQMLMEMLKKGFTPHSTTLTALICSLCQKNLISEAVQVLEEMISCSIAPDKNLWNALLSAFNFGCQDTAVHLEEIAHDLHYGKT